MRRALLWAIVSGSVLSLTGPARAGMTWTVTIDTSNLATAYTGPFGVDFELVGNNGNTVTLSNFAFGGGSAGPGPAFLTGGASGSLGSGVTFSDAADFFSDFNQQLTPGASLTFTMTSTLLAPPQGGTPDGFSLVLFQGYDPINGYNPFTGTGGTPIPTTDPSGADTLFNFNINGPGVTDVATYTDSGGSITVSVLPTSVAPEPSSHILMILGLLGSLAFLHRLGGLKTLR